MRQRRFFEKIYIAERKIDNNYCLFYVYRNGSSNNEFEVAFVVAPTKKLARAWAGGCSGHKYLQKCLDYRSTGKSGIKCLLWAQQQIINVVIPHLRKGDTLFVGAANEQRYRVYARLLKYGFEKWTRTWADGEKEEIYGYQP